ncbi:MAG TPA: hypothetical protein VLV48_07375 [Thermoanaerobaculia bacterium]|nr:hypothetical protein [Thermoanaerobaculia bacterium]
MKWQAMFQGDFISAVEIENKTPTLTIREVKGATMEDEKGKKQGKAVVYFREIKRGWVLAKTNALCIAAMFGDECDGWIGKRVTIHSEIVQVGPDKAPGIRVSGSPDIDKPIAVTIKLPRKKPRKMFMQPTGKNGAAQQSMPPDPEPDAVEPPDDVPDGPLDPVADPVTGETF